MDTEKKIKELEAKVKVLEEWMRKKKQQQISYPLDTASKTIISNI